MIAFLHTSEIHIQKFEQLVKKFDDGITVSHFVNDDLLTYAMETGVTDDEGFHKEIEQIKKQNPELIICTCSTYGEVCDKMNDVERIDEPIAAYLIANFSRIGLAYTANSTKKVSLDLLTKMAEGKDKDIVTCDCSEAWQYYESKDLMSYAKEIAEQLKKYEDKVDVVFLAQASMEGAKDYLPDFTKPTFSSPEFGVKTYLKK